MPSGRKVDIIKSTRRNRAILSKEKPEKSLLRGKKSSGGRNNEGKMTIRYSGGGHKKKLRKIDFKRRKDGIIGTVKRLEYDPNRTAFIALIVYSDGEKSYILAPDGLKKGDEVVSGENTEKFGYDRSVKVGCVLPLINIPIGCTIHNIEICPGSGGKLVRSAGCSATLMGINEDSAIIKLQSGEKRKVKSVCRATIGAVSNREHRDLIVGKAGRNRWKGIRPRTRGVAMNPVDHPMGGGEGKASGGHPRSRNGLKAKGMKTRKRKKYSNRMILERKNKRKK